MNSLGKFLKALRVEHGEVLFDMAKRLQVSSAFLSSVENGRRSAPPTWLATISREYNLTTEEYQELNDAISESVKQVRMNIGNSSERKKRCALAFARAFDDLTDEDIRKLTELLEKRGS